jgi:hypothetical protein
VNRFRLPRRDRLRHRRGVVLIVAIVGVTLVSFTGSAAVASGLVTGKQIKDGSLTSTDLKTNAGVTGADVRDGTLSPQKMSGMPQGAKGEKGLRGPNGLDGLDDFVYTLQDFSVASSSNAQMSVQCQGGRTAVGGGVSSLSNIVRTVDSRPLVPAEGAGWTVTVHNESAVNPATAFVWAVCVSAP